MFRKLKRSQFRLLREFMKVPWLLEKEDPLHSLLLEFNSEKEHDFLLDLLSIFSYIDNETLGLGLKEMASRIVFNYGLEESTTQICAITYDDEADSSQKFLDYLKMPLSRLGWTNLKTVNAFGKIVKNYNNGFKNIVFVDEFIGSGKTLLGRIKQLKNDIQGEYDLKIIYFSGMQFVIDKVKSQGYNIDCVLPLKRGISDVYDDATIHSMIQLMLGMENKLQTKINKFELPDYSLGYNKAESLYSLESCHGNTPNSVFPIFWWPRDRDNRKRKVIVERFERGLS